MRMLRMATIANAWCKADGKQMAESKYAVGVARHIGIVFLDLEDLDCATSVLSSALPA